MQTESVALIDEIAARYTAGCSCAQAVFSGLAPRSGLPAEQAVRIAASFGGGIGRQGQICGALSGALMALGLRYGHACPPADPEAKKRTLLLSQRLIERFRDRNGHITCPGLLGFDLANTELREAAEQAGTFKQFCQDVVRSAAEAWLELEEELDAAQP